MRRPIGRQRWAVAGGTGSEAEPAAWILNAADEPALLSIMLYFEHREPAGPYRVLVGARRTRHIAFRQLHGEEALPPGIAIAAVLESSVPIVVQTAPAIPSHADHPVPAGQAYAADA
jgi:hypothetical protein